jgi:hypothetical protein
MVKRSGRSSLGCLLSLLLVSVAVYVGVNLFEVYWRYFEFRDAMRQEVRFAAQITDDKMKLHLAALADSMGLPDDAAHVTVVRTGQTVSVSADYVERVVFPIYTRTIRFRPSATGTY